MTLRAKILLYLVLLHVAMGAIAILVLREQRVLLLVFDVLFLVSIGVGYLLVRALFVPLELIRTGAELIQERDFGSHFTEVGHPEMDRLIDVYNRMIDQLREERLKLQERNLFLDRLLTAAPSGVITLDHDGRVAMLNPAAERSMGLTAGGVVGRALDELDAELARQLHAIERGTSRVVALQGRRRLRCQRAEFLDRGFPRDFFLLEELTDELRASEKAAYDKLIRLVSHEVNNSVGSVRSLLDSCRNYSDQIRVDDREDFRTALDVAIDRMENLGGFVNGFADVVRIPEPRRAPCDVERLVTDLVRLTEPELEARGIRVERAGSAVAWPPLELDKNQIEQVLLNALKNAAEAIDRDGTISVVLEEQDGRRVLRIRDTGPGIAAEARNALFTPFFSTKRDGRGLGLTVIREVLTAHRFDFGLVNRSGGGAEFWVAF